jgi:hypothetical protein
VWWIEFFKCGFTNPGPIAPLLIFKIIFAVSCIIKFFVETKRGYFNYFDQDTFLFGAYQIRRKKGLKVCPVIYKCFYVLKLFAVVFLLVGAFQKLSLIILAISFLIEIQVYFKFHTNFFLLVSLALVISPDLDCCFNFSNLLRYGIQQQFDSITYQQGDLFPQFLIIVTVMIMYFSTVYRKLNPVFLSGAVVYTHLEHKLCDGKLRKHFDGFYPILIKEYLVDQSETKLRSRWLPLMVATLILEVSVPILLCIKPTQSIGIALGMAMHCLFTLIAPGTLTHFTLLTIGTYILFLDPWQVCSFLL